jgi:hypothetical protein
MEPQNSRKRKVDILYLPETAYGQGCRYPLWKTDHTHATHEFCDRPKKGGMSPYCEEHHARCYYKLETDDGHGHTKPHGKPEARRRREEELD